MRKMHKTIHAYLGLLRADGTEPPRKAGYQRVDVGEADIWDIPRIPYTAQIVFPDVTAPGCGLITDYALYDRPDGGEALMVWHLPEPVDCHSGIIPFIHNGKLYRGLDVSANIMLSSTCRANITN